jgi:predicted nucleic-acid-binding protein
MIAIDTNVLLRAILKDDEKQFAQVHAIFDQHDAILVTDVVLVETLWVLKGSAYNRDKKTLCEIVQALIEESHIHFESEDAVWSALEDYRDYAGLHFSDALIAHKSFSHGAAILYTFDVKAQQLRNVSAP